MGGTANTRSKNSTFKVKKNSENQDSRIFFPPFFLKDFGFIAAGSQDLSHFSRMCDVENRTSWCCVQKQRLEAMIELPQINAE